MNIKEIKYNHTLILEYVSLFDNFLS